MSFVCIILLLTSLFSFEWEEKARIPPWRNSSVLNRFFLSTNCLTDICARLKGLLIYICIFDSHPRIYIFPLQQLWMNYKTDSVSVVNNQWFQFIFHDNLALKKPKNHAESKIRNKSERYCSLFLGNRLLDWEFWSNYSDWIYAHNKSYARRMMWKTSIKCSQ